MNKLNHIGIIMDGNRRWAEKNGLDRVKGHDKGSEIFGKVCEWCIERDIPYITSYAFSTENWGRSPEEKRHLFSLLKKFFADKSEECVKNGIKVKVIGERYRFNKYDKKILTAIEEIEKKTENCAKLNAQIALSYGGRDEITRAVQRLADDIAAAPKKAKNITEKVFESYLDTAGIPDVDLVIRTGGAENRRLSNFLIWQTAYSELYFSDLLWPEFSEAEFNKAIKYYNSVKRKTGK